jgi:hypothetical protein
MRSGSSKVSRLMVEKAPFQPLWVTTMRSRASFITWQPTHSPPGSAQ